MTRSEHIPWPHECRGNSAGPNHLLAHLANLDERFHDGCGLRDTQINEVPETNRTCRFYRYFNRHKIDLAKLLRLSRTRMRHADQMDKSVRAANMFLVGIHPQRIANHEFSKAVQFRFRSSSHQRLDF